MLMDQEEDEFDERGDDTLDELIKDPLGKKKDQMMLTPQEYRVITIGHKSILKEGQMIQVAISDPFDKNKFYPTDKIIVMKHKDKLYALGSYCGFDFTNLATGALLGEKLVCPTCCSSYDIKNGLVDIGPSMRNLSNFNINIREIDTDIQAISRIPEEERSTHFIAIRISNPQIIRAAKSVQVRYNLKSRHFLKL